MRAAARASRPRALRGPGAGTDPAGARGSARPLRGRARLRRRLGAFRPTEARQRETREPTLQALRFWVQAEAGHFEVGGAQLSSSLGGAALLEGEHGRRYATRLVRQRLHQRSFRERVISAYQDQCGMCRLRHRNLLDAAHIKPDAHEGEPLVSNGISLCKIHHAAFDQRVLGIHPTRLRIHVRQDVLREFDGPMLRYGLQQLHEEPLRVPRPTRHRPDPELLRWKWEQFEEAG